MYQLNTVKPQLSNDSQVEQFRVWPKNLSKKCLSDRTNVRRLNTQVKQVKTECMQLTAKTIQNWLNGWLSQLFQFSNKSVVKHNFGTNYVQEAE